MAFRFSAAILEKPDGSIETLYVGPDGDAAKQARDNCDKAGQVGVILNVRADRIKKNANNPKPAAKAAKKKAPRFIQD